MKSNKFETVVSAVGSLGFLFFVPPVFLGLIPYKIITSKVELYTFGIGAFRFIGVIPILVGILAFFWSAWSLIFSGKAFLWPGFPPGKLVVSGLYRYVRNPMYVGGICILVGEALLFESTNLFLYALVMFGFFNLFVGFDEYALKQSFGESYEQYCKSVPRWIPRLKAFRGDTPKSS
jgi:protein-S-isoprenylcysteine O-methyltransferase Ste14